jgi:hypothetical protein
MSGVRGMVNTLFSSREEFLQHAVNPLPLSAARGEKWFQLFRESGYLARQEPIGLTVLPKFAVGTDTGLLRQMTEGAADAINGIQVVVLSQPSMDDEAFDDWVDVLRTWAGDLPPAKRGALSRKIRQMKRVEEGLPLSELSSGMPEQLLFSYQRHTEWVMVFDPADGDRTIWATKGIG